MEEKIACAVCGTETPAGRTPSFWTADCGWTVEEYVHGAVVLRDWKRFDPRLHRNQGYMGSGSCTVRDCAICEIMRAHGV